MILTRCNGLGVRGIFAVLLLLGCARVNIESKKPIKVDVTMRLDIYQHVAKDVTEIEDLISAPAAQTGAPQKTSLLSFGVQEAYAEEEAGYPQDVRAAIENRKVRRDDLVSWESKGVIGENNRGLVEVRDPSASGEVAGLVSDENRDRAKIHAYVAAKNGASLEETAKVFAQRIQADALAGTPVQQADGSWVNK